MIVILKETHNLKSGNRCIDIWFLSQKVYFSHDWSRLNWLQNRRHVPLNGPLKHGMGGVARCPAMMMSSIGALCGTQAHHSLSPPRCVLLITPFHRSKSKNVVGRDSRTNSRKPPHLIQTRLWYSYSEEFCLWLLSVLSLPSNTLTQHTFILPHTLWSTHTPRKIPGPFTSSARYTSCLPLTCFYKVKHSQEEGKNTWSS